MIEIHCQIIYIANDMALLSNTKEFFLTQLLIIYIFILGQEPPLESQQDWNSTFMIQRQRLLYLEPATIGKNHQRFNVDNCGNYVDVTQDESSSKIDTVLCT